jgi:DNA-nicking Smr family endonuclease
MSKKNHTDDMDLFRRAVGNVKPLKDNKTLPPSSKTPRFKKRQFVIEEEINNLKDFSIDLPRPVEHEDRVEFSRSGVQMKQLKKLREGKFRCEAECDLHHLTEEAADKTLETFIHDCVKKAYRVVRIVPGKGYRSGNAQPILKNLTNQRLREFKVVLAFCSALPKDGGTGAIYVLLKSNPL